MPRYVKGRMPGKIIGLISIAAYRPSPTIMPCHVTHRGGSRKIILRFRGFKCDAGIPYPGYVTATIREGLGKVKGGCDWSAQTLLLGYYGQREADGVEQRKMKPIITLSTPPARPGKQDQDPRALRAPVGDSPPGLPDTTVENVERCERYNRDTGTGSWEGLQFCSRRST